jgi:hypothetical protein
MRAWKGQDWDTMERLHTMGFISDPKSKAKSVVLSEEGEKRSKELFAKHFALKSWIAQATKGMSQPTRFWFGEG